MYGLFELTNCLVVALFDLLNLYSLLCLKTFLKLYDFRLFIVLELHPSSSISLDIDSCIHLFFYLDCPICYLLFIDYLHFLNCLRLLFFTYLNFLSCYLCYRLSILEIFLVFLGYFLEVSLHQFGDAIMLLFKGFRGKLNLLFHHNFSNVIEHVNS
jgi:hypothetical protein